MTDNTNNLEMEAWMDESGVPKNFLFDVEDRRLRRLIREVWQRLPAHDREVLSEFVLGAQARPTKAQSNVLGYAGPADLGFLLEGCAARIAEDYQYVVNLNEATKIESDAACMFVIAHEFAHVVLRHGEMSAVVATLRDLDFAYTEDDPESLTFWHEEHADLQAWLWGFEDEYRAFQESYPDARRPRWDCEIHGEEFQEHQGDTEEVSDD